MPCFDAQWQIGLELKESKDSIYERTNGGKKTHVGDVVTSERNQATLRVSTVSVAV
jgi:hypothetical protein